MKTDDWTSKWAALFVILMSENYKFTKNERHNLAMLFSDKKEGYCLLTDTEENIG